MTAPVFPSADALDADEHHFCSWHKADILRLRSGVRFRGKADIDQPLLIDFDLSVHALMLVPQLPRVVARLGQ
jgi:hypothetical protein